MTVRLVGLELFRAPSLARWAEDMAPVLVLAYLLLPGHPLGLLTGLPLGPVGLAVLVLFGLVIFAAWPLAGRAGSSRLAWFLCALCLLKAGIALVAPPYGLAGSYYARPGSSAPPEWSSQFPHAPGTRLDRELSFVGDTFPLYFFNDNVRFNYYREDEPDRLTLPFSVRWRGFLDVPAEGDYRFWLTSSSWARLRLAGTRPVELVSHDKPATVEHQLRLPIGAQPILVEYIRYAGMPAQLAVEWDGSGERAILAAPFLMPSPSPLPSPLSTALMWLARVIDFLFLLALSALSALFLRQRFDWRTAVGSPAGAIGQRQLVALLLAGVFAWAALSTLDIHRRVVLLDGGSDWLTYETYARDILENGPLMTLDRPLGKGRPYYFQPFYPYVLAAAHWLTGEDLYGIVVLQLFGLGVAAVLVYALSQRLFGRPSGLFSLAIVLGMLLPLHLEWVARHLLSENIYFWLLPAAALAVIRLGDRPSRPAAAVAGLLLGLCCVTRAPTLLWVPLALLVPWRRLSGRRSLVTVAGLVCLGIVLLVPLRNYVVSGHPAPVATNATATMELAHPLTPSVDLRAADRNPLYATLRLDTTTVRLVEFIRQDPLGYAATLVPLGLYALGLPGMLEAGAPPRWELVALVALYVAYLCGASRPTTDHRPSTNDDLGARVSSPASGGRWSIVTRRWSVVGGRSSPAWLLHSFIWLHLLVSMIFLPNVYGYRQVLPMYLFIAVFAGQVAARWATAAVAPFLGRFELKARHTRERKPVEQYVPRVGAAPGHEELA